MNIFIFLTQLFGGRIYKYINGEIYFKEGFGDWEQLESHLKKDHPKIYDELIENQRKTK